MLELSLINKRYSTFQALTNVSLTIPRGSLYGLLGPNGAGKTSLLRIITQIILPDSGEILLNNMPVSLAHREQIGYLPEERGLYKNMKVIDQLHFLAALKNVPYKVAKDRVSYFANMLQCEEYLLKRTQTLSKGQQQKIQLIAALLHHPQLLILDEPFSGLDPINADLFKKCIYEQNKQGTTIIFSTHQMEWAQEMCDFITLLNASKVILQGTPSELCKKYQTNTYLIKGHGLLPTAPTIYETKVFEEKEGYIQAELILMPGITRNTVLDVLIKSMDITHFSESVPSLHEVFIHATQTSTANA